MVTNQLMISVTPILLLTTSVSVALFAYYMCVSHPFYVLLYKNTIETEMCDFDPTIESRFKLYGRVASQ